MSWLLPVLLRIVTAYVVSPIIAKQVVSLPSRTQRLAAMFFCCAVGAWLAVPFGGVMTPVRIFLLIAGIGALNAVGAYCQWRAIDISLSRSSLFTFGDDCIAIALGYLFLNEAAYLSPVLVIGIVLSIWAVVMFASARATGIDDVAPSPKRTGALLGWVAGYSVIWGGAMFSMRAFALDAVPVVSFVAAWYTGAFLGSLLVGVAMGAVELGPRINIRECGGVVALALISGVSLALDYSSRTLAPITVVQPMFQVSEMVLPTLIGLFLFREATLLRSRDVALFIMGGIGIALIVVMY